MILNRLFSIHGLNRPSKNQEKKMRSYIESKVFDNFKAGLYTDSNDVNQIIRYCFNLYMDIIQSELKEISSSQLILDFLNQYDRTIEIRQDTKNLWNTDTMEAWKYYGPIIRRAIKFMIEHAIMNYSSQVTGRVKRQQIDKLIICIEELIQLSMQSESTYAIFPEQTTLELKQNSEIYYDLKINNSVIESGLKSPDFLKLLNGKAIIDSDLSVLNDLMKEDFCEKFKAELTDLWNALDRLIDEEYNEARYIKKEIILEKLALYAGISKEDAFVFYEGLSINSEKLNAEGRNIINPKQEKRLLRRFFIEMKIDNEEYVTCSKGMAIECRKLFLRGLSYKKIPSEWNPQLFNKSIEKVNENLGIWFENLVEEKLRENAVIGYKNIEDKIGSEDYIIDIPEEVGEIDFIGYDSKKNELLLIECKIISPALEPKYFRDDYDKFMRDREKKLGYKSQFEKKVDWVKDNVEDVKKSFGSQISLSIDDSKLRPVLLTFYPSIIEGFITEFEVYTLSEFIETNF